MANLLRDVYGDTPRQAEPGDQASSPDQPTSPDQPPSPPRPPSAMDDLVAEAMAEASGQTAAQPAAEAQDPAAQDPAAQDPAAQDPAAQDPAANKPSAPSRMGSSFDLMAALNDAGIDTKGAVEVVEAEPVAPSRVELEETIAGLPNRWYPGADDIFPAGKTKFSFGRRPSSKGVAPQGLPALPAPATAPAPAPAPAPDPARLHSSRTSFSLSRKPRKFKA